MRMVVLGLGYLGATHAACMAELGHEVLGVEVVPEKRDSLARGEVPFYEPELPELLKKHIDSGKLRSPAPTPRQPTSLMSSSSRSELLRGRASTAPICSTSTRP